VNAPDLRRDAAFIGRYVELTQLLRNLQRGRHTLITGEKGIGKTRLMLEAKLLLGGMTRRIDLAAALPALGHGRLGLRITPGQYRMVFLERACPLGDGVSELAEKLFLNGDLPVAIDDDERSDWQVVKKRLAGLGSAKLQGVIAEGLSRGTKPYLLFLESLDRIAPGQQKFIEMLLSVAVVCASVVQMKDNPAFKKIWASFAKIELEPLPDASARQLVDYLIERYPVAVTDVGLYRQEILKASGGNPFHIRNMLWHGSREKFLDAAGIRRLRRGDEGHYFNMGPIYIFVVAVFTLFKIFSIGMDNREFYIYFSALGFVAFLLFRVFRAFFLFRPQKHA
jgi:hypothetical protein